jgi:sulfate/thiosulfate-binding protein
MKALRKLSIAISLLTLLLASCSPGGNGGNSGIKLVLAAYTTPREAYAEIIPLFQAYWKEKTGQTVTFDESYLGSGAQARAVIGGFEADVVALSLEADITSIVKAGLITHDWKQLPNHGIVSTSVVALAVRAGNPKKIAGWADLARPGIEILTPNPQTSGGAMWNVLAIYGAALRGKVEGVPAGDANAAKSFLVSMLRNVTAFDKGARESITNFEQGVGDVAITYENEVLVGRQQGQDYQLIIPSSTILIENPVAVVDVYADKHGTRQAAEAFVNFLFTTQAQQVYAKYGLRPIDPEVARQTASQYPAVEDLFTIADFGGWDKATPEFFGEQGIYSQAIQEATGGAQ